MTADRTLPVHPVEADLTAVGESWMLTFERTLRHPIAVVWSAITDAGQLRRWAPFVPSRNLDSVGAVALTMLDGANETEPVVDGNVTASAETRLLVLLWGDDELRFTLEPDGEHTRLTFTHSFAAREEAASYAAGWHLCLAALMGIVQGQDVPPVAGNAAFDQGWEGLSTQYGRMFGPHHPD